MSPPTKISYARRPSMVPAYARVLLGRKPYSAPDGTVIEPVELEARKVVLSTSHIQRYREVCAVPASAQGLPPAYLHVLAMPLHMQLFVVKNFPVKVLGLIHLRNTIRVLAPVDERAPLKLRVYFETMRVTDYGQEYDFTTSYEQSGTVVWEEVSTMFARGTSGPKEGSKRPVIERSGHPETGVATDTLEIADNTGWRYARVSGDFNPIHLTARTAQMFGFKQAVAHGMWSMGRCLASAALHIPNMKIQIDTQFKLPVYIPSQALARTWSVAGGADISMCTMKGDRLHLAMQVRTL
ncbi:MAG: MaoC/PaaZ C-terminal domain-containing protein [Pseudomonadota bacterium]|nr:MaoC/PaaZ C-terminal domain-containing protein [Pseudomonadota bacterium]